MKNRFSLVFLTILLTGCASLSTNIADGNFKYVSTDVSVSPFGANYSIDTLLEIGNQRVTATTMATSCEKNFGTLDIKGKDYFDRPSLPVTRNGNKKEDQIFNYMCSKGLPIAYEMENRLSDADKSQRQQAVVNYLLLTAPSTRPSNNVRDVNCVTNSYPGAAFTNCTSR
jgi:hypothetical protein